MANYSPRSRLCDKNLGKVVYLGGGPGYMLTICPSVLPATHHSSVHVPTYPSSTRACMLPSFHTPNGPTIHPPFIVTSSVPSWTQTQQIRSGP